MTTLEKAKVELRDFKAKHKSVDADGNIVVDALAFQGDEFKEIMEKINGRLGASSEEEALICGSHCSSHCSGHKPK